MNILGFPHVPLASVPSSSARDTHFMLLFPVIYNITTHGKIAYMFLALCIFEIFINKIMPFLGLDFFTHL